LNVVCVSKHREEGIAKESRNVLIMNVSLYVFTCVCLFMLL